MKTLISGCPGSGKTSVVAALTELGHKAVDMDTFGYHFKRGNEILWLVPKRAIEKLLELVEDDIFVAGLCNNLVYEQQYINHLGEKKPTPPITDIAWDAKFWLTYDEEELIKRVTARDNPYGRKQAERDEIKRCLEWSAKDPKTTQFTMINTTGKTPKEIALIILGEEEAEDESTESGDEEGNNTVPPERAADKDESKPT
jgi:shikimate kinase